MKKTLAGFVAVVILTGVVHAETFNVTRMDDPVPDACKLNDCSLREAVNDANQTPEMDTIILPAGVFNIDLTGTDTSLTGDLDISTDMVIVGAPSIIDGQQKGRIMDIRSDAEVTLRDLTLRNANSSLATNGSLNGGALFLTAGVLDVTNDTFSDNKASGDGGAIYMFGNSVLTMLHATLSGDSANRGSALYINLTTGTRAAELGNNLIDGDCDIGDASDISSLGGNIEGNGDSCVLDASSDLVNQSIEQLGLLPLASKPGGTPTHKLTATSVARGQAEPGICASVKIDQLFEKRGNMCNSGADESDTILRDSFETGKTNS